MSRRVLLLLPTTTYKAEAFIDAALRLDAELMVGTDVRQALEVVTPGHTVALDFSSVEESLRSIAALHEERPFCAVVGSDDESVLLAAAASAELGLPHNPQSAVQATRDKHLSRRAFRSAGLRVPTFRLLRLDRSTAGGAAEIGYPCVLKPLSLSGGRGVIRADDDGEFGRAVETIRRILAGVKAPHDTSRLLVERYVPGTEIAVEGLLEKGRLRVLAVFDKPDPLVGPTFEETLYVTPSRLPDRLLRAAADETEAGCSAIGLREGPVHAELRIDDRSDPWLIEVAARTIGGLCARTLRFGTGVSLEELVLRHALGDDTESLIREDRAAGAMMIPIPRAGMLRRIDGIEGARSVEHVEEVTLTMHRGDRVEPLPEGHRYLGFIFASATSPDEVETALRRAHSHLRIHID